MQKDKYIRYIYIWLWQTNLTVQLSSRKPGSNMWRGTCLAPLFAHHPLCSWQKAQSQPFLTLNLWVSQHCGHKQQFKLWPIQFRNEHKKQTQCRTRDILAGKYGIPAARAPIEANVPELPKRNDWTSPFPGNIGNTMPYQQDLLKKGAGDMLSYLSSYCVYVFGCRPYNSSSVFHQNKWSVLILEHSKFTPPSNIWAYSR